MDPREFSERLALAEAALRRDALLGPVVAAVGPCRLEPAWQREPYDTLIRSVAYQQLHGRAAEAILGRFLALFGGRYPDPAQVLGLDEATFRSVGFSASKMATIKGIAAHAAQGGIPNRAEAEALDDEALIARLIPLRGVGRWTVEMLLIFTLGRLDVWPVDDFGVRNGYRVVLGAEEMPAKKALAAAGEAWRPWRSVASWYLWRASETKTL